MNIARTAAPLVIAAALAVAGCGGGGSELTGPILDISDVEAVYLDQIYMNGGMEDDFGSRGEFSVYLRDAATGEDFACTSQADGMDSATSVEIYYGGLSVPFRKVRGAAIDSAARFRLVFVENDVGDCQDPIDIEDDIVGISNEVTFEGLLGKAIWAANGRAAAALRREQEEELRVRSMAPSMEEGLFIDKLYFEYDPPSDFMARFYIHAEGPGGVQCQIDDSLMRKVRSGRVIYAALGFPVACIDATDPDFPYMQVALSLYAQEASGPKLIGRIDPTPIESMVGKKLDFTNDKGYFTFRRISPDHFGAPVVRLADLVSTVVTSIEHALAPSTNSAVELFALDGATGLVLACAGQDQGLGDVSTAGLHEGLSAGLIAAGWTVELFGYDAVRLALVERTDGLSCPLIPSGALPVMGSTVALGSAELSLGSVGLTQGAGTIRLVKTAGN